MGMRRRHNKVLVPESMITSGYTGEIYGNYVEDSGIANIYDDAMRENLGGTPIGYIRESADGNDDQLCGYWAGDQLKFRKGKEEYQVEVYSLMQNIFSRNTGILESAIMIEKTAVILGCGSVGSLVALELCRAGVGNFLLMDNDVVEYHNLCRHQCNIYDVGKYKVNALKERILAVNPAADVAVWIGTVETAPKEIFDEHCMEEKSIIIGCADNRAADVYANSIAVMYKIPFISVGFWERAFAGEIFYYLPNRNMPCYKCALGDGGEFSNRVSTNRRIYTNEEDLEKVNFEPGISIDINFVTTVGIKLILDILNMGNDKFTPRVLDSLKQYTLVCNTNKTEVGGDMAEIFSYPLQVTTSLEVSHGCNCPPCEYEG
ncbi:MAG: ThiF family adenylyltransferase [Blautia sp.]|nr:ThiF family adenylyltransferase [Blautia sp.]